MMLYSECGYFNEERNDEYAPPYGECEKCYRYDICKRAKQTTEERKLYPYPLIILRDRYNGAYSGGIFTAWNKEPEKIPYEVGSDDMDALDFWQWYYDWYDKIKRPEDIIGIGNTPNDAIEDLIKKQKEKGVFHGI